MNQKTYAKANAIVLSLALKHPEVASSDKVKGVLISILKKRPSAALLTDFVQFLRDPIYFDIMTALKIKAHPDLRNPLNAHGNLVSIYGNPETLAAFIRYQKSQFKHFQLLPRNKEGFTIMLRLMTRQQEDKAMTGAFLREWRECAPKTFTGIEKLDTKAFTKILNPLNKFKRIDRKELYSEIFSELLLIATPAQREDLSALFRSLPIDTRNKIQLTMLKRMETSDDAQKALITRCNTTLAELHVAAIRVAATNAEPHKGMTNYGSIKPNTQAYHTTWETLEKSQKPPSPNQTPITRNGHSG